MTIPVQITFDCADPDRLAHFWAELLGYELDPPPPGYDSWEAWLTEHGVPEADWNMASAVSDPTRVARTTRRPDALVDAPTTASPGPTSTGTGSPVRTDVSTAE